MLEALMLYSPAFRFPARKPRGAKLALKPFHVWGIRVRLQVAHRIRDLALFDLALDSKLRGCDLIRLRVSDLVSAIGVKRRVMILQQKTGRPVQFEASTAALLEQLPNERLASLSDLQRITVYRGRAYSGGES